MKGLLAFKVGAGITIVALGTLIGLVATTEFLFSFMEVWDTLVGRLLVAELAAALFIFGCWAILRDGWAKGIAWMIGFLVIGMPGVGIFILWHMRNVKDTSDLRRFFLGRHVAPARSKVSGEGRTSGAFATPAAA